MSMLDPYQMMEGEFDASGACIYCGYWIKHSSTCSRPQGAEKSMFDEVRTQVPTPKAETKPQIKVSKNDPNAEISIELVDKRHIVIRRCSMISGIESVNLHYTKAEDAEAFLEEVRAYAKRVEATETKEAHNAYAFKGLANKLIIKHPDVGGTRVL